MFLCIKSIGTTVFKTNSWFFKQISVLLPKKAVKAQIIIIKKTSINNNKNEKVITIHYCTLVNNIIFKANCKNH